MQRITVKIARLNPNFADLPLPAYATEGSSGMDLYAALENEITIAPGERSLIPCNFQIEIPTGYEAQIRPRSGLAVKQGVTVLNTPGTIDSDYRGEVKVILINLGTETVLIRRRDRIAQMVIAPVIHVELAEVEALKDTTRGAGGFGHTGT